MWYVRVVTYGNQFIVVTYIYATIGICYRNKYLPRELSHGYPPSTIFFSDIHHIYFVPGNGEGGEAITRLTSLDVRGMVVAIVSSTFISSSSSPPSAPLKSPSLYNKCEGTVCVSLSLSLSVISIMLSSGTAFDELDDAEGEPTAPTLASLRVRFFNGPEPAPDPLATCLTSSPPFCCVCCCNKYCNRLETKRASASLYGCT